MGKALHFELPAVLRESPQGRIDVIEALDRVLSKLESSSLLNTK